ncbi:MAG: GNAT family N-acetyltransferase [Rhabdochlamydiaceae bacterium]
MTIIEKATVSDAEEILLLQKLAYKSEGEIYDDLSIPPLTQTLQSMQDEFRRQIFLKATVDEKIIGSVRAFAQEEACHIGRLMVHPDFQHRGIGKKLMNEIESLFKSCKRFELFTGNKSEKNICLYQKIGYKIFKTEEITDKITLVYLEKLV